MKKIFVGILAMHVFHTHAQNLVLNYSFEDTIACSTFMIGGYEYPCTSWFESVPSPDYLSSAYEPACGFTYVPQNIVGFQYPKTGYAYMGLATYVNPYPTPNRREYLGGKLSSPLIANHDYCVSFYVSAGNNCKYFTDAMGIYFSVDSINPDTTISVLPYMPQISNPAGNVLSDTLNWMLISGTFKATGGERYMCVGSFTPDTLLILDSNVFAPYNLAYYYVDDVSVVDCTVGIKNLANHKTKFVIAPNPVEDNVKIKFDDVNFDKKKILLKNILGIKQMEINGVFKNEINIDCTPLTKGVYIIEITENEKLIGTSKFCKVK